MRGRRATGPAIDFLPGEPLLVPPLAQFCPFPKPGTAGKSPGLITWKAILAGKKWGEIKVIQEWFSVLGTLNFFIPAYYGEDSSFSIKMIDISVSTFSVTKETRFSTSIVVSFMDPRLHKAFHKQLLTVTACRSPAWDTTRDVN